jgi:NAD(P)H-hydrate epimerase
MIKIFSTDIIKQIDQYTIKYEPVSSIDLVERAAGAFVSEFCRRFSKQSRIVIFAGPGNNGADALAIARMLHESGYKTETYLFNTRMRLSKECEINKERLIRLDKIEFDEVVDEFVPPRLTSHDIVVDGLFGAGLNHPLSGGFAAVVNYINSSESSVVSVDVPSGLFGEENKDIENHAVIRADLTLAFQFPRLSFLMPENYSYVGEWKVLDIQLHEGLIDATECGYILVEENDIASVFQPRPKFAHKGMFGHALLIAGSKGKMGAALLAAKACERGGAGLLTVHVPQRGELVLQTECPEAMVSLDNNNDMFTEIQSVKQYSAIGVGPGLGKNIDTAIALENLLISAKSPLVVDADAINIISENKELIKKLPSKTILTPHPKEFDRLCGDSNSTYDRLQKAKAFAMENNVIIVLKGAYTAICTPTGNVYFNSTGNPGMAKGGSGDVLTGVILSLLAQGKEPETAAVAGVYLHGLAGDMAAKQDSEESITANDIVGCIGIAYKHLK